MSCHPPPGTAGCITSKARLDDIKGRLRRCSRLSIQSFLAAMNAKSLYDVLGALCALCDAEFQPFAALYYSAFGVRESVAGLYGWIYFDNSEHMKRAKGKIMQLQTPVTSQQLRDAKILSPKQVFHDDFNLKLALWIFGKHKYTMSTPRGAHPGWLLVPSVVSQSHQCLFRVLDVLRGLFVAEKPFGVHSHVLTALLQFTEQHKSLEYLRFLVDAGVWSRADVYSFLSELSWDGLGNAIITEIARLARDGYFAGWSPSATAWPLTKYNLLGADWYRHLDGSDFVRATCPGHGHHRQLYINTCVILPAVDKSILKRLWCTDSNGLTKLRRAWSFRPMLESVVTLVHLGFTELVVDHTVRYVWPLRALDYSAADVYSMASSVKRALARRQCSDSEDSEQQQCVQPPLLRLSVC